VTIEGLATQAGIGSPPPGGSQPGFGGVPPKRPPAAEAESRESGLPAGALAKAGVERVQENALHPVQRAWLEIDVPQCGYCQAGQIMTAAALLARNGNPTDEEIVAAMNGNLCRCGTYLRIRAAVRRAASLMASTARGE
jgi:hypothetical protein